MINIIAAATIALSTPTDTTIADSSWVTIFENWEMNLNNDEVNTINNFLDNSVDSTWTETQEGWVDIIYKTNESFDTIVAQATDSVYDRYFDVRYWGKETHETVELINKFSDDLTEVEIGMIQKFANKTADTSYYHNEQETIKIYLHGDTTLEYYNVDWDLYYFNMYVTQPKKTTSK